MTTLAWFLVVKVLLTAGVPSTAVVGGLVAWELREKAVAVVPAGEPAKIADNGLSAQ